MQNNKSHPLGSIQLGSIIGGLLLICSIVSNLLENNFLAERFAILFYWAFVITVFLSFTEEKRKEYIKKINNYSTYLGQQMIIDTITYIETKSTRKNTYVASLYSYKGSITLLSTFGTTIFVYFKQINIDYFATLFHTADLNLINIYTAVYYGILVGACVWILLDANKKL